MTYKLYGAEVSYYTGKIRGYMRWKGISFEEITTGRNEYINTILPRVGWPVIPVLITPEDKTLQDTSDMIDYLEVEEPGPSVTPNGAAQKLVAYLMELYGDEWLTIPAMHYRWNYNRDFAYTEFGSLSLPEGTREEQHVLGEQIGKPFSGALPPLGINEDTIPAIEKSYLSFLDEFSAHLERHPYLIGSRPSIGDYGLLGPLYAHLWRDPESGKIMKAHAPKVSEWVQYTHDPETKDEGDFLADDEVPETLIPILARQFREQFPVLEKTASALNDWAKDKTSGEEVPRNLGMHDFELEGVTSQRAIFPFNLWMLQRAVDVLETANPEEKARIEVFLRQAGGESLLAFPRFPRLVRSNFKLCLA